MDNFSGARTKKLERIMLTKPTPFQEVQLDQLRSPRKIRRGSNEIVNSKGRLGVDQRCNQKNFKSSEPNTGWHTPCLERQHELASYSLKKDQETMIPNKEILKRNEDANSDPAMQTKARTTMLNSSTPNSKAIDRPLRLWTPSQIVEHFKKKIREDEYLPIIGNKTSPFASTPKQVQKMTPTSAAEASKKLTSKRSRISVNTHRPPPDCDLNQPNVSLQNIEYKSGKDFELLGDIYQPLDNQPSEWLLFQSPKKAPKPKMKRLSRRINRKHGVGFKMPKKCKPNTITMKPGVLPVKVTYPSSAYAIPLPRIVYFGRRSY